MHLAPAALAVSVFSLCAALPILADELAPSAVAEARPADALDSVLLISGEVVRGVVRTTEGGVTVRLRSGEERELASAEIRRIYRWEPASSPPPTAAASTTAPLERRWYGAQNLGSDALAVTLGIVAIGTGNHSQTALAAFGYTSLGIYALGSPIIHAFHQESLGTSFASLGLRLGLPLAFGLITYAALQPGVDSCEAMPGEKQPELGCGLEQAVGVVFFGAVGMVAAMIIDDSVLARETVNPEASRVSLAPLLLPRGSPLAPQGATGVSFAARF